MKAMSYSHGASVVPLLAETIGAALDRIAGTFPEHDAVVCCERAQRLTYRELKDAVDAFARGLIGLGVGHGDRVGIWAPNSIEWVVAQFAVPKIGAILVTINPADRTNEAAFALAASGVSVLLAPVRYKTSEYAKMLADMRGDVPALRHVVLIGDDELEAPLEALRFDDVTTLAGERVSATALAERLAATHFDEPVNIQYTSGFAGVSKGAVLTHHNVLNNGFFVGEGCRYSERDRVCVPVPFYHCFGMVLANLAIVTHGAAIVIPSPTFDPDRALAAVERERCTSLCGVPAMFAAELALSAFADYDLRTLRTAVMAGAPCPEAVMRRVRSEMHVTEVIVCYGMTETSPVSTQTAFDDPLEKRTGSVGRVMPHLEVKIVDDVGRIVERGVPGELCTRGYSVMLGYWNDAESTARAIDAARYMHTGDIAVMDDDGYLNIVELGLERLQGGTRGAPW